MRVLGIDPSLQSTGIGIIEDDGDRYKAISFGIIKPGADGPLHEKLNEIRQEIFKVIESFEPDEVSVENPFFARNVRTALLLGQVRGAVLIAVAERDRPLAEYSALEIKKAVTGYGQADKGQVETMVKQILGLEADRLPRDASDALAAAICHLNRRLFQIKTGGSQNS